MAQRPPEYNTHAVAKRTGVPAETFLSWERRYGVPHPARDRTGRRRYSDEDIRQIEWLRDQTQQGFRIGDIVAAMRPPAPVTTEDVVVSLAADPAIAPAPASASSGTASDRLLEAIRRLDDATIARVLAEESALASPLGVVRNIIAPTMMHLDDAVASGELDALIHAFATATLERRLGALLDAINPARDQHAIVAGVGDDTAMLDVLLVALEHAHRGTHVLLLGSRLSLADLGSDVLNAHHTFVFVAKTPADARIARSFHEHLALRRGADNRLRIALEGPAFASAQTTSTPTPRIAQPVDVRESKHG